MTLSIESTIRGWNAAGREFNAAFLHYVFRKLETPQDVEIHNFIMFHVFTRLGPGLLDEFSEQVADLIQQLSQRNLSHGKKESKKEG